MGTGLWEQVTFDLRECTRFAEFDAPTVYRDSNKYLFVNELDGGGRGDVSETTV